jgi:protein-disulfide isomerase
MNEHTHIHDEHVTHDHKKEGIQLSVPGAIVLGAFIISISILLAATMLGGHFGSGAGANTDTTKGEPAVAPDIKNVALQGLPFIGNPEAPVILAYWSDYQCPFCKIFETTTFQTILEKYVQSGKVAVVFKDFAFLGPDSTTAAVYSRAVWELYPEKYFAWREAMYNAQDEEHGGFGDEASIVKLTGTIPGLDAAKIKNLVATKMDTYQALLNADREEGISMGIDGTPSFITGTKSISGNVPFADFAKVLDAQLK